ncbi:MAG: D-glycero-beta-D-manno-heptose 1-phosphate adenylyltransferase [Candidatus Marinimicrobia bacterium]|nr:D-glycero-beta-D-manno-heptose 1-phosphate adenylyltransferase [Candidatus Neomarinimicrobiota bacterium]
MAILDRKQAAGLCRQWRKDGNSIVFTNGCFDLIHRGHIENLQTCKSFGDKLVIGMNSDISIRKFKEEGRPIITGCDRAVIIDALEVVDLVVLFDEDRPQKLVQELHPDIMVKGDDYKVEEISGAADVLSWGGRVELIPLKSGYSTSSIIDKIIHTPRK